MRFTEKQKRQIFNKTRGICHLCGKPLTLQNYNRHKTRGSWNVDHSKAQAVGGSDHLNNLFPACISCNSSKGIRSSRSVRKQNGLNQIPGKGNDYNAAWLFAFGLLLLAPLLKKQKYTRYQGL